MTAVTNQQVLPTMNVFSYSSTQACAPPTTVARKRKAGELPDDSQPFKLPKQQSVIDEVEDIVMDGQNINNIEREAVVKGFTAELVKQKWAERSQGQGKSSIAPSYHDDFQWMVQKRFIHDEAGLHGV